jgi:hypothetical protein
MNLDNTPLESYSDERVKQYNALAAITKGGVSSSKLFWVSALLSLLKVAVDWFQSHPKEGEPRMAQPNPFDLDSRVHL